MAPRRTSYGLPFLSNREYRNPDKHPAEKIMQEIDFLIISKKIENFSNEINERKY